MKGKNNRVTGVTAALSVVIFATPVSAQALLNLNAAGGGQVTAGLNGASVIAVGSGSAQGSGATAVNAGALGGFTGAALGSIGSVTPTAVAGSTFLGAYSLPVTAGASAASTVSGAASAVLSAGNLPVFSLPVPQGVPVSAQILGAPNAAANAVAGATGGGTIGFFGNGAALVGTASDAALTAQNAAAAAQYAAAGVLASGGGSLPGTGGLPGSGNAFGTVSGAASAAQNAAASVLASGGGSLPGAGGLPVSGNALGTVSGAAFAAQNAAASALASGGGSLPGIGGLPGGGNAPAVGALPGGAQLRSAIRGVVSRASNVASNVMPTLPSSVRPQTVVNAARQVVGSATASAAPQLPVANSVTSRFVATIQGDGSGFIVVNSDPFQTIVQGASSGGASTAGDGSLTVSP